MKALFISDIRNFLLGKNIYDLSKPDCVFMLGDLLLDGPGQFYVLKKPQIPESVNVEKLKAENAVYAEDEFLVVKGNTHVSKELFKLHLSYFLDFVKYIEKEGSKAFLIYGNHDKIFDYNDILSKNEIKSFKVYETYGLVNCADKNILLVSYGENADVASYKRADLVATHKSTKDLFNISKLMKRCSLVISGHYGTKLIKISSKGDDSSHYERIIVKIDHFPLSFASVDFEHENVSLYTSDESIYFKTKISKDSFTEEKSAFCFA